MFNRSRNNDSEVKPVTPAPALKPADPMTDLLASAAKKAASDPEARKRLLAAAEQSGMLDRAKQAVKNFAIRAGIWAAGGAATLYALSWLLMQLVRLGGAGSYIFGAVAAVFAAFAFFKYGRKRNFSIVKLGGGILGTIFAGALGGKLAAHFLIAVMSFHFFWGFIGLLVGFSVYAARTVRRKFSRG